VLHGRNVKGLVMRDVICLVKCEGGREIQVELDLSYCDVLYEYLSAGLLEGV